MSHSVVRPPVDHRSSLRARGRELLVALLALSALALVPSCSSGINTGPIRAFNRPVSVAFACFDTRSGAVVPTAACTLVNGAAPANFSMHALVPQETRGEVAAVDLIARTVLDSDRRIPGYTFVPVGALPGPIVVPPNNADCTFVANRGSNTISVIDTRRFRSGGGAAEPFQVPVDGSPTDMVATTDESALWVAMADLGVVQRLPIIRGVPGDCTLGAPDLVIDLGDASALPPGVPVGESVDLMAVCPLPPTFVPVAPAMVGPRDPAIEPTLTAAPATLAIDDEAQVLLVGDRALPLIHRVSLADGTTLAPIATGAPISDVALTPRVPDSYAAESSGTTFSRYIYAVDASDGTVMVVEYSDPTRADFGAVIPVNVTGTTRPDRIPLGAVARALEVVSPSYDETAPDPRIGLCDPLTTPATPPAQNYLRGVFLSVATADGAIRFVDVYDLDAPCRGRTFGTGTPPTAEPCRNPTAVNDVAVYIRRHRPRGGGYLLNFAQILQPTVLFGAATDVYGSNGEAGTSVPSLAPVTCPEHLRPVDDAADTFGTTTRVCGLTDPFAVVTETWSAAWQGTLPGTSTTSANAGEITSTIEFDSIIDYCARGVIGSDDVATGIDENAPEAGYLGDLLAITGTLPAENAENELCQAVAGVSSSGQTQKPVLVALRRAFSMPTGIEEPYVGRLVVDATAPLLEREPFRADVSTTPITLTIQHALDCYGDHGLAVDVRSQAAFTTLGGRSGFTSRVVRDETDGHCGWDTSLDPLLQGRAFLSRPFVNARIAFQLDPPDGMMLNNPDVRIVFTSTQTPLGISLSVTSASSVGQISLPSYLSWNEPLARLYGVDTERRGLVELTVLPLTISNTRFE